MTQAKDRQRKRENKRAKRSLVHKASVKQRNTSKVGVKKKGNSSHTKIQIYPEPKEILLSP